MTKKVHFAVFLRDDHHMSALCSNPPGRLNPQKVLWTSQEGKVTCARCLKRLPGKIAFYDWSKYAGESHDVC
jgi:hypothetical protein